MSELLLLGARSLVAAALCERLQAQGRPFLAASRQAANLAPTWIVPGQAVVHCQAVISLLYLPALLPYLDWLQKSGCRRLVALSSTSRFSKLHSSLASERATALALSAAEEAVHAWAEKAGIDCIILRPTLIYGRGRDQNLSTIVRFAARTRCVLLPLGSGGRRQPIHADDVAAACLRALDADLGGRQAYDLPGGETLSYAAMLTRLLDLLDGRVQRIHLPVALLALGLRLLARLPGFAHLTPAMAERMREDLVFDAQAAIAAFGYEPQPFTPQARDLPSDLGRRHP